MSGDEALEYFVSEDQSEGKKTVVSIDLENMQASRHQLFPQ